MPRRDGLPTNREMVVDFNTLSRTAYVDAYNRMTEDGLPDAFKDKPLAAMYLLATKEIPEYLRVEGGVSGERLEVEPLQPQDVDFMTETLGFKDTPEDVVAHYHEVARRIGETTLHTDLDLATVLPAEGVIGNYTATYPGGRTRHIATFKEKPSKASIAAGKFFAEQVVQDINAPALPEISDIRDFMQVVPYLRKIAEDGGRLSHILSFRKVPNLPLNGYESTKFLNAYANTMLERANQAGVRLERLQAMGAPEVVVESAQNVYDSANDAFLRAQTLLDKK